MSIDSRPHGPSRMRADDRTTTEVPVLIIGAGHCGLSVAMGLKALGIDTIVLEEHAAIGDQWRERYERLHLHHITDAMHLPGVPYPSHVPRYPSRLDLADYLAGYARIHDLDVRLEHRVTHLERSDDGRWRVTVEAAGRALVFTAPNVVVAAGSTGVTPIEPTLPGRDDWAGEVRHSVQYTNATPYVGQRVLIVGSGNSAVEIGCDLFDNGAFPAMLIRSPNSWITRESFAIYHRLLLIGGKIMTYVPFVWLLAPLVLMTLDRYLKHDVARRYGDLREKGVIPHPTPPMQRMAETRARKPPVYIDGTWGDVGSSIFDLIKTGEVAVHTAEIDHLRPGTNTVVFKDGTNADFDVILLCTGFAPIAAHYATFIDRSVMADLARPGVFVPGAAMPDLPGLWLSLGGLSSTRYAQQVLARRIAARVTGREAPKRILSGAAAFAFAGIDPGSFQVRRRTIVINVLAVLALIGGAILANV